MSRRVELLNYASEKKCWIFEDDYDSEFRYDTQPLPALTAMDTGDRVIYSGTFSKVMFPSLRLGYIVVPAALKNDFFLAKRAADRGCPAIEQAAMARYMANGGFERHLRRIVQVARLRRKALIDGLERVGKGIFRLQDSHAGMHLVAWLPNLSYAQCDQLVELASLNGVGLHPIRPLYTHPPKMPGLILGYAALSVMEINAAMDVLGQCIASITQPKRKRIKV